MKARVITRKGNFFLGVDCIDSPQEGLTAIISFSNSIRVRSKSNSINLFRLVFNIVPSKDDSIELVKRCEWQDVEL